MTAAPVSPVRTAASAAALDALFIVVFVLLGLRSHEEDQGLLSIAAVAWPFLVGALVGWLVTRAWRAPASLAFTGPLIWLATVVIGLPLRGLSGGGLAPSFMIVTAVVLAVFLIGWRALALLIATRRGRRR